MQMSGLDLNAPILKMIISTWTETQFCTQDAPAEMVEESPGPMVQYQEETGARSNEHSGRGLQQHGPQHTAGNNNSIPMTTVPTGTTTYADLEEGAADGSGMHEEVASSPTKPFLGMRFDTIEAARAHYNAYVVLTIQFS
jgi:hypothetical protein